MVAEGRSRRCFKEIEAVGGVFLRGRGPFGRSRRCFKEIEAAHLATTLGIGRGTQSPLFQRD